MEIWGKWEAMRGMTEKNQKTLTKELGMTIQVMQGG